MRRLQPLRVVCPVEDCITMVTMQPGQSTAAPARWSRPTYANWTTHPNNPMAKAGDRGRKRHSRPTPPAAYESGEAERAAGERPPARGTPAGMPVLDWIGKKAVVNHHREVPYRLLPCDSSLSAGGAPRPATSCKSQAT